MWGYSWVAGVLNGSQSLLQQWFSPTLSGAVITLISFGLFLTYQSAIRAGFRGDRDNSTKPAPPSLPSIFGELAAVLIGGWFAICLLIWLFSEQVNSFAFVSVSWLAASAVAVVFFVWLFRSTSGTGRAALAILALTAALTGFVQIVKPEDPNAVLAWVLRFMLLASLVSAYVLYRAFRGRPGLARPARALSRSGSGWPPLGPPPADTFGDAQLADPARHARAMADILGGAKGIWFGTVTNSDREASYIGDRHLLTVAPNRTGKGTCTIIPNMLMDSDHSIICIDPKGQNAAVTARARRMGGRPVYCLNPFGEHTGAPWNLPMHGFNPLAHMSIDDPNVEADVAALAEAIIVTESQTQPYFENSARDLIEVLILHALATKGKNATLLDMRAWLGLPMTAPDGQPSLLAVIAAMKNSSHSFISEMSSRFLSDTKSVGEIVQSATNQTKFLSHRAVAACLSGNDFQMIDFKNRQGTLYVILPERYLDAYSRFLRLVVVSALNALRSRPGGVRTILMMDEFARLGSLKAVEQAVGSSAGFNVQLWPFVQDLNQLQHLYPKRWDSFIANAGVVQWFTPNDQTTAAYLSQRIGKTTVINSTRNESTQLGEGRGPSGPSISGGKTSSSNESEVAVDFLSTQDLYNMPKDCQILTLAGLKYPVCCTREPYYSIALGGDTIKAACDPDPFHT
jgi:type IV secretion system protein VirD4